MRSHWIVWAVFSGLVVAAAAAAKDDEELKWSDCPAAVRKTLQAESKGAKIETVTKERNEDETIFWADVTLGGKAYSIGVLEDGTLSEMNLAVDEEEVPFDRGPAPVKATFRNESFGEKVETLGKDMKYGVTIYEAVVDHKGKSYQIVVAEDGTLVEKVLVIDDEEIELSACPAAVRTALQEQAKGGRIGDITRSTGIGKPTYETEIEIKGKVYLIEVAENGLLISKSLQAD
jgi:hypothetical protein